MPPHESTPLLGETAHSRGSAVQFNPIKSSRYLLLNSWLNILLVAIPLAFVAEHAGWSAAARFSLSFIAIVPLAKVC